MMKAIDFVVRTGMGAVQFGEISANQATTNVAVERGSEISLNLRQSDVGNYMRDGSDLKITLADGRVIVLQDYFAGNEEAARLFISADGYLNEVSLVQGDGGAMYANYGPTAEWGKWSPSEELIFVNDPGLITPAGLPGGEDEVSMLGVGLLGGTGLFGGAGVAAAAAGVVIGAGGGGGGGGGGSRVEPLVNEKDPVVLAGDDTPSISITGEAEPGSTVVVTIGDKTETTTADENGEWAVEFKDDTFPADGSYPVDVVVTEPNGTVTELAGPPITIDTTPPLADFTYGTASVDHIVNGDDHQNGVEVSGTGEAGATIEVTIGENTHTTTISEGGTWAVVFPPSEVAGGEYETEVSIVVTDSFGNAATYVDTIVIDTLAEPITIAETIIGGNGTVNFSEMEAGFVISGTSTAGETLVVTVEGVTQNVVVGADGTWTMTIDKGQLPGGEYDANISITTTDAAGNTNTETGSFRVDTVGAVGIQTTAIAGNDVINAAERNAGVTLTGTSEPGSTVNVMVGDVSKPATVAADGTWSVVFGASDLPTGDHTLTVTATATDGAGNVTTATDSVRVDTAGTVAFNESTTAGDGMVNGAERAAGITLTGSSEPGSTVSVTMNGYTHAAVVDANGNWSANFAASEIPSGERSVGVTVNATDANGNASQTTGNVQVDTLVNELTMVNDAGGADRVINAVESQNGATFSGRVEAGSTVKVAFGSVVKNATVGADGTWTVSYNAAEISQGNLHTVALVATATDAAGNTREITSSVKIDTIANDLTLSGPVEGDNVINYTESLDGVRLTGTATPNAIVKVNFGSGTRTVAADANGNWSANFSRSEIPADTASAPITATTTDAAGNVATATGSVRVDTVVDNMAIETDPISGNGVVNSTNLNDGLVLTGTAEPGSTVKVIFGTVTVDATVAGDGSWTAVFNPNQLPTGEKDVPLTVQVTDQYGNVDSLTESVSVDTLVNRLEASPVAELTNGFINSAAAADGVVLTGKVEAGSRVVINFDGTLVEATVDANGNWTANVPASAIQANADYTANVTITATDAAGNTAEIYQSIAIDTEAPDGPVWENYSRNHAGVTGVSVDMTDDALELAHVKADGSIVDMNVDGTDIAALNQTFFGFSPAIPDGSHLVISSTDAAGNVSGTYMVLDEVSTSVVDMPAGLSNYQIESIDLQFAEDSVLTLTEAQVKALSTNSDTVTIHGGSDDTVNITGAQARGSVQVDGQDYTVYTLGDEATLIIDENINVVI